MPLSTPFSSRLFLLNLNLVSKVTKWIKISPPPSSFEKPEIVKLEDLLEMLEGGEIKYSQLYRKRTPSGIEKVSVSRAVRLRELFPKADTEKNRVDVRLRECPLAKTWL